MTDFTQLSDKELSEALDFHRRQRNMSRGINESAHARQIQTVRILEAEEARRLEEAKKPKPGHNAMVMAKNIAKATAAIKKEEVELAEAPLLGPKGTEHRAASMNQSDREYAHQMSFKNKWKSDNPGKQWPGYEKAGYKHPSYKTEEVEQIDELSKKTLGSYVKKASTDQYLKGQAVQYHTNKAQTADGVFAKQSKTKHYDAADKALKKASNRDTGIGRAVDRMTKEEVEQIDELSKKTLRAVGGKMLRKGLSDDPKADKHMKYANMASAKLYPDQYKNSPLKARVPATEEVEQIDEISDDLKAKYLDKAVQQRYDRFVTPRNTSAPKPKGAAKKAADAAREKANAKDTRRAGIIDKTAEKLTGKPHYNKMSTMTTPAVHGNADAWWKGKKYAKEEVELDEASYRDSGYANMWKASRKADKEADKMRAQQAKANAKAAAKASKPEEFKEEADLRITKVYNKWPKKATYAVHTPDRKYFKEFDSMEAAKAHHAEKSGK